jgi:hypothetical protein
MVRVHVPGLCGLALRVTATTNGVVWHHGVLDTATRSVETIDGAVIPRSQVLRLRHDGGGTWISPLEAREVVLLLSMIGGMPHHQLLKLAWEGMKPEDRPVPRHPRGRPRKHPLLGAGPQKEIPVGLNPVAAVPKVDWYSRTAPTSR